MQSKELRQRFYLSGLADVFITTFYIALLLSLISAFVIPHYNEHSFDAAATALMVTFGIILVSGLVFYMIQWQNSQKFLQERKALLAQLAQEHKWKYEEYPLDFSDFASSSLTNFARGRYAFDNMVSNGDWAYADYAYEEQEGNKSQSNALGAIYYAVVSIKLPRQMPHIFFDSKKLRGSQFSKIYKESQQHSLEYNFNNYFDTYFPDGYTIDAMSYVTPDVMECLIAAQDYDIEMVDDRLFIYGYMRNDEQSILSILEKADGLHKRLKHALKIYRDQRVPHGEGRKRIAPEGMSLQKNNLLLTFGSFISGLYIFLYILILIYGAIPILRM
jgi:hypothetical protein